MSRVLYIVIGLIVATAALLIWNDRSGVTFGMDNEKFARAVSLALMAAWVGTGLMGGRFPAGSGLRNVAIWLGIFLVIAAGYQYRSPLQDFASSMTLGLVPASPLTARGPDGQTQVSLGRNESGHFEADSKVNGATIRFMIDTGASSIVLSARDAASAGIDIKTLRFGIPVSTANGKAMAAGTRIDEISVGGIVRRNMPALVASEGAMTQSLLGMDFLDTLSGYAVEQDRMVMKD